MAHTEAIWVLWLPDITAQGLSFARGRLDSTGVLFVHAAGEILNVEVPDEVGAVLARGTGLKRTANTPMARLKRHADTIAREDVWPEQADYGSPVIVAGGDVGILQRWWGSADEQEWRWSVEFYNHW